MMSDVWTGDVVVSGNEPRWKRTLRLRVRSGDGIVKVFEWKRWKDTPEAWTENGNSIVRAAAMEQAILALQSEAEAILARFEDVPTPE